MEKQNLNQDQVKKICELYSQNNSIKKICNQTNITRGVVTRIVDENFSNEWKIIHNRKLKKNKIFCYKQKQVIMGTLLGDGCLSRRKINNIFSYTFKISHGPKQQEYTNHLASILDSKVYKHKKGQKSFGPGGEYYVFTYHNKKELEKIYNICFKDGKKHVNEDWLNEIDALGIAYWFLDDGSSSFDICQDSSVIVRIASQSFSEQENNLLIKKLLSFGIEASLRKVKDGTGATIYIKQKSINKFMDLIEPYVETSDMKYKIKRKKEIGAK